MLSGSSVAKGMRALAIFEAVKSGLLLIVGFGLFSLISRDVSAEAETFVRRLHLNPVSRYPHIFIEASRRLDDTHLWLFATLAATDAIVRGIVGWGLWYNRTWAKWLGVITAGIYLPLEVYEIVLHITALKVITFITNVAIVAYLAYSLKSEKRQEEPQ